MDKQTGLNILGLGPAADRTDARAAFRRLAKVWHPDRFATDPLKAKNAEEKMKQVNEAFHFLLPLLPKTIVAQEDGQNSPEFNHDRTSSHGRNNWFQGFLSTLVAGLKKRCNEKREVDAQKTGRSGQAPGPGPYCQAGKSGRARKTAFDTVFQNAVKRNRAGAAVPRKTPGKRPVYSHADYGWYFNSVPARSRAVGYLKNRNRGPVEAISPVAPVKRR
nr:J domain-containing protein [uncultured Desulfobacter sp.]